jgi:hypothetical protein
MIAHLIVELLNETDFSQPMIKEEPKIKEEEPDLSSLSARERHMLKRKSKLAAKQSK